MSRSSWNQHCPQLPCATDYVRDEMHGPALREYESHLGQCGTCREHVDSLLATIELLEGPDPLATETAPAVAERLVLDRPDRTEPVTAPAGWPGRLRPAASIALLLIPVALWFQWSASKQQPTAHVATASEQAVLDARTWLAAVQEPSGAWSPSRFGGDDDYGIALTSLAALAIAGDHRPEIRQHARSAARYLSNSQQPSGHLGPLSRSSLYNHSIGTVALAELTRLDPSPTLRRTLERAVQYLAESQSTRGGWGAVPMAGVPENECIGFWALEALSGAHALGVAVDADVIANGRRWFAGTVARSQEDSHRYGPRTSRSTAPVVSLVVLASSGQPDARRDGHALSALESYSAHTRDRQFCVYDAYFLTRVPTLVDYRTRTDRLLVDTQVRTGEHSGSWELSDQWSSVGGRLYSTALAALALENSKTRAPGRF